jgi:hypothetical protein
MSWLHTNTKARDSARDHASVSDVLACFKNEEALLLRLALLITGDETTAGQCVVNACDMTVQGHSPFRDWLTEWAKAATITSAISRCVGAIRGCEAAYKGRHCTHPEHLSQVDDGEREHILKVVLGADPGIVIAELDPLSRAVLVLRVATRSSVQDCVLRLNVSRAAVVAANCEAMTKLRDLERKELSRRPTASATETRSDDDPSPSESLAVHGDPGTDAEQ